MDVEIGAKKLTTWGADRREKLTTFATAAC